MIANQLHKLSNQEIIESATASYTHRASGAGPSLCSQTDETVSPNSDFIQSLSCLAQPLQKRGYTDFFKPLEMDRYSDLTLVSRDQKDAAVSITDVTENLKQQIKAVK